MVSKEVTFIYQYDIDLCLLHFSYIRLQVFTSEQEWVSTVDNLHHNVTATTESHNMTSSYNLCIHHIRLKTSLWLAL